MAGFFGLFDYSKPGPGVQKDGPKKKSFVIFFEIFTRKFWKLITVNLLYVLFSLPVVTVGLANAGLAYVTRNFAREKHAFVYADFVDTIKKNWKQALIIGLINLVVTIILIFDIVFFFNGEKEILGYVMLALILSIYLIFSFMKYYMHIMVITFKLTIKQIYKNSFIFATAGLLRNLMLFIIFGLCYALAAVIYFSFTPVGILVILFMYIFLFPAFRMLLINYTVFPLIKKHMIDPYYKEHPDEDKEAKRALNILEDDEEDEEERVFEDTLPSEDEEQKTTFPRQYSEDEMRRLRHKTKRSRNDIEDDDGTI
ncbi:MAG: DUF624 domain-containing protein [Oscillospiraceae bacterium]|nr:DUF624 domain-containing protein [Oscillospiraceae bacterium]